MRIVAALENCGGVARTCDLFELGFSRHTVETSVRVGVITRMRKGLYCADPKTDVARAAWHGGAVTCVSALASLGIWLLHSPTRLHVHIARGSRTHEHHPCACLVHHTEEDAFYGRVGCVEALLAAMRCLSHEEFFAAFESAWRRHLITRQDRERIIGAAPAMLAGLLRFARGDADSGLESIFRFRLLQLGIQLESQVTIDGVGRVDFRYKDVLFEIDGKLNHDGASERHKDLLRDAAAARLGYRVLRFNYAMIVHDWETVIATVRCAIARPQAEPVFG